MSQQEKDSQFVTPLGPKARPHLMIVRCARPMTAAQWLERGVRELAVTCKRNDVENSHAYPCPAIAETAQGIRFPLRILSRIIVAVLRGGGPVEFGERLGHLIITFNAQAARELGRPLPPSGERTVVDRAA